MASTQGLFEAPPCHQIDRDLRNNSKHEYFWNYMLRMPRIAVESVYATEVPWRGWFRAEPLCLYRWEYTIDYVFYRHFTKGFDQDAGFYPSSSLVYSLLTPRLSIGHNRRLYHQRNPQILNAHTSVYQFMIVAYYQATVRFETFCSWQCSDQPFIIEKMKGLIAWPMLADHKMLKYSW